MSQATVSRILRRAEEEEIVRVTVNIPTGIYSGLENELSSKYGLKAAIVVHCEDESDEAVFHYLGSAAAYYVETTIGKNEVVGLSSWSSTLLGMGCRILPRPGTCDPQRPIVWPSPGRLPIPSTRWQHG